MFSQYLDNIDLYSLLTSMDKRLPFPPVNDREAWGRVPTVIRDEILAAAKAQQDLQYPLLSATQFLEYVRSGERMVFEEPYFVRRRMLLTAVLAECLEDTGLYMDQVINGLWCICEESFWGVSAHNGSQHMGARPASERPLPDVENPYIDLFAAQTSSLVLWSCHLLKEKLDAVTPLLRRRALLEADRRIIKPFFHHDDFWWMGMIRQDMNNWTPWILSNIIASLILTQTDDRKLVEGIKRAMRMLDSYLAVIPEDGGCDEGAGYWNMAGASLLDCLEHIYYLTGGRVSFYNEAHIKSIGLFPTKSHISGPYYWNFADCDARPILDGERVYRYGQRTGQQELSELGIEIASIEQGVFPKDTPEFYRTLCKLFFPVPKAQQKAQEDTTVILPDLQIWAARRNGMYAAVKGGHNAESHNHNDVGSFLLYVDGEPEILDAGNMTYTAKTFGPDRYNLWNTRSMYHNVPLAAGFEQHAGKEYAARNVTISDHGISLDIAAAYPKEAGILALERNAYFLKGAFQITDTIRLEKATPVAWGFLFRNRPQIENGILKTKKIILKHSECLQAACEEIPITDKRMVRNLPESLWRVTLTADSAEAFCETFTVSRRL